MPYKNPSPDHDNELNILSKRIYAFQKSLAETKTKNCKETCSRECIFRTVISRSYYASFLHARKWLKNEGVNIRSPQEHTKVLRGLKNKKTHSFSDKYKVLLDLRVLADYKDKKTVSSKHAKDAIALSDNIISKLKFDD